MKKYNPLFYLLFILLIMGAFASMAQNSYGLKIIGIVAFIFGFVFVIEFSSILIQSRKKKINGNVLIEPACLMVISVIGGLRVFYIYFPGVEWIFTGAAIILISLYLFKMAIHYAYYHNKNGFLALQVLIYYLSIIFFLASLIAVLFKPSLIRYTGSIAVFLLLFFVIAGYLKRQVLVEGNSLSAFKMVVGFKGHSIMLTTLMILFSLYFGLNRLGLIPAIYSDEYPQAYYELIDEAETSKEKPISGEYKYQLFLKQYDRFVNENSGNTQSY